MEIVAVGATRDAVGESPFWNADTSTLHWVDIAGRKIRSHCFADGSAASRDTGDFPTALALSTATRGIVSFGQGVMRYDFLSGAMSPLAAPESARPLMRLNEGKCDPRGRFWSASMDNNLNPDATPREMQNWCGGLYRITADGAIKRFGAADLGIPNTMAWSPDRKHFYFGDSMRNVIHVWDYDDASGEIDNRRVFVEGGPGGPDGSTMDSEGCLWNARFGGGQVIRFDPDGRIERILKMPVSNPTACTFGGRDLKTLFVTSSHYGLPPEAIARNSLEGALFGVDTDIRGQAENYWREAAA